ncbi:MAG TPA: hypothetical protein VFU55_11425 [Terracidiphilus sp.]|nr:hypothetical protein [Terracidiphilus sp.]
MRAGWMGWTMGVLLLSGPAMSMAASCTTQAEMSTQDRNLLAGAGQRLADAIVQQNYGALQASLLPQMEQEWSSMQAAAQNGAAFVKGGTALIEEMYLLDDTDAKTTADQQFFCSNASGSLTVTLTMRSLPPGKYALVLADAAGATMKGKIGLVLVWDATSNVPAWQLGGLTVRQGATAGHDGVWWWRQGRALAASGTPWAAYYSYAMARALLLPVDFLSSPNLEKLNHEQGDIASGPAHAFPLTVGDGARTWKIEGVEVDTSLHEADLRVTYDSLGMTDPAAARTEATAVLSALLKAHPDLRANFHGLWAYAVRNGTPTPVMELAMKQIP